MPTIRPAVIDDLPSIAALFIELKDHHHALEPHLERYLVPDREWWDISERTLRDDEQRVMVAEDNGVVIGFANYHFEPKPWGRACHVDTLLVTEAHRGDGVGTELMNEVERVAIDAGAKAMRLEVLQSNVDGRTFYETRGYSITAIRYGKPLPTTADLGDPPP
jgi:ribosomal protein S18 acetylase RimI-like enzyme